MTFTEQQQILYKEFLDEYIGEHTLDNFIEWCKYEMGDVSKPDVAQASGNQADALFVVEGANLSLLMNNGATRRGRKLHYAKQLNTYGPVYSAYEDKEIGSYNPDIRTLCNLVVYGTEEASSHTINDKQVNCGNCLNIARRNDLVEVASNIDELDRALMYLLAYVNVDSLREHPNYPKAKAALESIIKTKQLEARIDELEKWHTMVKRLVAYVDSPDSLTEYEDRLTSLRKELHE